MRINGFRCDGCGKEHLLGQSVIPQMFGDGLPREWYTVHQNINSEPWLFCSKKCLREHPLEQRVTRSTGPVVRFESGGKIYEEKV